MTADSSDPYKSKIAVITGGSRGIGYHISSALVDRGTKVVIGSRNEKQGQKVAKEFNERHGSDVAVFLRTDVSKYDDLKALFALAESKFGGVDIAIMNAGVVGDKNTCGAFSPLDDGNDMSIQNINIGGVIKGNKVALLHMAKQNKGGVIVNTSSMAGLYPTKGTPQYNASKSAVNGWTAALNLDVYSALNIRVNAVSPCYVETDILNDLPDDFSTRKMVELSSKSSMENCVSAFLHIIEDSSINGEILGVWPEPLGFRIEPKLPMHPELVPSKEILDYVPEYSEAQDKMTKEKAAEAIKRAGI